MKLKNNFTDMTRELFMFNYECFWCKQNGWDCMHHILGRVTDSPLNCAPIHNFECHIGNGLLATDAGKSKLLNKTLQYLLNNNYELTSVDKLFKKKYENLYNLKT